MDKRPSLRLSLVPVIFLITLLVLNVWLFKDDSSYGPNQLALLLAGFLTMGIGVFVLKQDYKTLEKAAMDTVGVSLQALMILLIVGSLISIWIFNGVVPTMIYYGIKLLSPVVFLPICLVLCAIVSLATGSSWSTVGTIGIALIGIGKTLGVPEAIVAGAIVSGSYFGDKMSPLSDTTNLAPTMAGTDLFTHIKHMSYTTGWAFGISFILYAVIGIFYSADTLNAAQIQEVCHVIEKNFNVTLWLFLLPFGVGLLVVKKVPALPALAIGTFVGALFIVIFQYDLLVQKINGDVGFVSIYKEILQTAFGGFKIDSGNAMIDKLFSRGGMSSMLNTIWLILMAMIFGGILEATGMLHKIADSILKLVSGVTSLVAATVGSAMLINITASDQYISIVVTGKMFKKAYRQYGLHPKNLSRAVEDGGTVTSVLIPWNTCGAYFSGVMGVATLAYLPFAFFNILSPICSVIVAATGKTMDKLEE